MTEAECTAIRQKIENLTPDQINGVWILLVGGRTEFYEKSKTILDESPLACDYIDDADVKRILTRLMHEDYVLDAITEVTEGN